MVDLDNPHWSTLTHAYGIASDTPKLLRQLATEPNRSHEHYQEEPWFSLWSSLCHQGDVYTASYAAVPHLLQIAMNISTFPAANYFLLPTCIEIARLTDRGPQLPHDLATDYHQALEAMHALAYRHAAISWDEGFSRTIAAALVVTKGHARLADTILELSPEIITEFRVYQGLEEVDDGTMDKTDQ